MLKAISQSARFPCAIRRSIRAGLWTPLRLANGLPKALPIADVLTMLEVRRRFEFSPHFARAYAVEILSAARAEIQPSNQPHIAHRKEPEHAVA